MYAVFSALAAYAACTLFGVDGWLASAIMLVVAGLCAWLLRYKYKGDTQLKIGIFILLIFGLAVIPMGRRGAWDMGHFMLISFLLFLAAFGIWNMDKYRLFRPRGWGHGLWHVMTAAALALAFYGLHYLA